MKKESMQKLLQLLNIILSECSRLGIELPEPVNHSIDLLISDPKKFFGEGTESSKLYQAVKEAKEEMISNKIDISSLTIENSEARMIEFTKSSGTW